jgi:hypothetical protein
MLRRFWRWVQARYRLDMEAVCELSKGKGPVDFHDYPDDEHGSFMCHMVDLQCKRCGKLFRV